MFGVRAARAIKALRGMAAVLIAAFGAMAAAHAGALPRISATALPPSPLVSRVAVFGADDRKALPGERRALERSVGLLYDKKSRTVCSAFCVGDEIIATAGHCVLHPKGEPASDLATMTFRLPALKKVARVAGAPRRQAGQQVTTGSIELSTTPPIAAADDWALVKLDAPVCKGGALAVSARSADDLVKLSAAQRIYQVSFHRDLPGWQLAYGAPCSIRRSFETADRDAIGRDFSDAESVIFHDCDTGGASSGSPLLMDGAKGPEVIGINVGTYVQARVLTQNGEVLHRYKADSVANTGASATAFAPRLDAFLKAEIVSQTRDMLRLQTLLSDFGLYGGDLDGRYGSAVRQAIEAFEVMESRPVTGFATIALLRRLEALEAERGPQVASRPGGRLETGSVGEHRVLRGRDASAR